MRTEKRPGALRPKKLPGHADDISMTPVANDRAGGGKLISISAGVSSTTASGSDLLGQAHATMVAAEIHDRTKLLAYDTQIQKQVVRNKWALFWGLATAGVVMAAVLRASADWRFVVAASAILISMELGLICYIVAACRCLRRVLDLVQLDLESGVVRQASGRMRSVHFFWRVVQDDRTRALYLVEGPLARRVSPEAEVHYRAAIRSRIVLSWYEKPLAYVDDNARR
jgi:hypothetical protein